MKDVTQVMSCLYDGEECWTLPDFNVAECIAKGLIPIDYHYHMSTRTETIVIAKRRSNGYYFFRVGAEQ